MAHRNQGTITITVRQLLQGRFVRARNLKIVYPRAQPYAQGLFNNRNSPSVLARLAGSASALSMNPGALLLDISVLKDKPLILA